MTTIGAALDPAEDMAKDLRAAWDEAEARDGDVAPEAVAEAAPVEPAASAPEVAEQAPVGAGEAARGPDGKFVAKPAETAQDLPTDQPQADDPEALEPIRPPAAWSAAAKAQFSALPRLVQEEAVKRERDMDSGLQERANRLKQYEPIEQVIAPYRDKLALRGATPEQAIQRLLAAQDALDLDPIGSLVQIARSYGIHPQQLAQSLGQAPAQPALPPELQDLQRQVTTLSQSLSQREQSEAKAKSDAVATQIETFRADPKHLYFENVSDDMALLLEGGRAADLSDAYDKACWANPEIRALILADQTRAETEKAAAKAKAEQEGATRRAKDARHAAGSIAGSRGDGVVIARSQSDPNSTIEDDVRRAFEDASARA